MERFPILRYFDTTPGHTYTSAIELQFATLANDLALQNQPSAEATAGLRKLLEARDCFLRVAREKDAASAG